MAGDTYRLQLAAEGLCPALLEEAAHTGGEREDMPCAAQTLGSQVGKKDARTCPDFAAWRLQKLTSVLRKEKGQMKAGIEEKRKFQIKQRACSLYSYSVKDDSSSGETP